MSVARIVGLETEFGILEEGAPYANPVVLSAQVVEAVAAEGLGNGGAGAVRWDYHGEDPLNDARGYRRDRASAHPSQLTDDPEFLAPSGDAVLESLARPSEAELRRPRAANTVITNGARVYVDHAHPEYSAPETSTPRQAALYDRAGELVMAEAMDIIARREGRDVRLYKNNVDGKGASYGSHENYLIARHVDFDAIVRCFTPFFVTRPIICAAGRVGIGQRSQQAGFQISQRADYVENDVGLETTFDRPIINTRDEPHADAALYRRLHVIGGDANQFDVSLLLKVGTTSLLAWMLETGADLTPLDACILADPVEATWAVSHDPTLTTTLAMADGSAKTALEIQRIYLETIEEAVRAAGEADADTAEVLSRWRQVLDALANGIFGAAAQVEWVAKYQLLESMRARAGLSWDDDKLRALDLQWHDLRPERSIVARLRAAGRVETLFSDDELAAAAVHAPATTRAYLRGGLIASFPGKVAAAGWDGIVLDVPGQDNLLRLPLAHPDRATRELVGDLLEGAQSVEDFLVRLSHGTEKE